MPWQQWTYLQRVLSADFQTYLQNQVVAQFSSIAQRDAVYTPVPPAPGAMCFVTATGSAYYWNGTKWVGLPRGQLAYVALATSIDSTPAGSVVASASLTLAESRLLKITGYGLGQQLTSGPALAQYNVREGGTTLNTFAYNGALAVNAFLYGSAAAYVAATAGAHTYSVVSTSTAGSVRTLTGNAYIAIEDCGTP